MDYLKRALSLPLLFKDWDDPFMGYRQRKRNNNNAINNLGKNKPRQDYNKKCHKHKFLQTWNRLVESRSTSKIPSGALSKNEDNERRKTRVSHPHLTSHAVSIEILHNPQQRSSSSCDLAPALLSIYDNYASSNHISNKNGVVNSKSDLTSSASKQKYQETPAKENLSQSCHNVHWNSELATSSATIDRSEAVQESCSVEILNNNSGSSMEALDDEDVHMKDEQITIRGSNRYNNTNRVNISVSVIPCADVQTHNVVNHHATNVVNHDNDNATGSTSSMCLNSHVIALPVAESDGKKRPLSISSTSSSASSSSSLPRHQRKKVATMATSVMVSTSCTVSAGGVVNSPHLSGLTSPHRQPQLHPLSGDQYCELCKHSGQCPHKLLQNIDSSGNLSSGQCSCAQSNKDGQLRHICRVHGPAMDITIARAMCPNCNINNHSKMGGVGCSSGNNITLAELSKCGHICDISEVSELSNSETSIDAESSKSSSVLQLQGCEDLNRSFSDPCGTGSSTCSGGHNRSPSVASHSHRFVLDFVTSYMGKVVYEIIETERVYVSDLRDIVQGYISHLDGCSDLTIDKEEMTALFGNIHEIYDLNREFLEYLELCELDPVQVAKCFVDRRDGFLIYADYCTNYPSSVEVLTKVMMDEQLAELFKHQQMALHHALPLGSYLLKPVQRILKYHLFLENMLNNFDSTTDESGHDVICEAFQSMTDMAQHINEMKRQHERAVHIQEIQSTLFGWDGADLTTYGNLLLEDTFRMHGAKAYRRMYLFEKGLIIAKRKEDGNLLVKGTIKCSDLMLVESIPKEPLSFHVIPFSNPRMQNTIQARNLEHKHKWCQEIKRLMIENFQAVIPDKAKQLMMMLGKSKEEEEYDGSNKEDQGPTKKQHTVPEYLEKRRQRRRSTSIIPDFGLLKSRRGRRQSEDSVNSSPGLNKSEGSAGVSSGVVSGSGFVSYLSRKPSSADVVEEEDEEELEALSEGPSSTQGSSKSSTLDSQVFCLDDEHPLAVEIAIASEAGELKNAMLSLVDIDETCIAAKRISRDGSDEKLKVEGLAETVDTTTTIQDTAENTADLPSSHIRSSSPFKRVDSYRKAYELNRVDSVKVSPENRSNDLDDGCLGIVFNEDGFKMPVIGESSTDDPKYIILPHYGESSTDADCAVISKKHHSNQDRKSKVSSRQCSGAQVIANNHAKISENIDSSAISTPAKSTLTNGAIIYNSCNINNSQSNTSGAIVLPNSLTAGECAGMHTGYDSVLVHTPTHVSNWQENDLSVVYKTSTPVSSVQVTRSSECSPIHTSKTAPALGSMYNVHHLGSPVRMTSDLKNGVSQTKLDCVNNMDISDPWIPRMDPVVVKSPCSRYREKLRKQVFRQHSMSAVDNSKKIATQKRISKLYRSNSCTSLDDNTTTSDNKLESSHNRKVSDDNSTLVFANKSAFLVSDCPHTVKESPEIERTLARLGTPPREFGPDYLLEEINECKEKGKIVSRYGTPPRDVMDPSLMLDDNGVTVFENKYSCALEQEILENLRQEMQEHTIRHDNSCSGSSSKSQLTSINTRLISSQNVINVVNHQNGTVCENGKDMWDVLQQYIQTSPTNASPAMSKMSLHQISGSHSSPTSRPGSFYNAMSNSVINQNIASDISEINTVNKAPERIVDSLKHAVMNLTSKMTRRSPRSIDASPVRVNTRRARSVGAEEDSRINKLEHGKPPKPNRENRLSSSGRKREKKPHFVFQLARTYSDKLRRHKVDLNGTSSNNSKVNNNCREQKEIVEQSNRPQPPDIKSIGERMADVRPKILGTYTLARHRRKVKCDNKQEEADLSGDHIEMESTDNGNMQEIQDNTEAMDIEEHEDVPASPLFSDYSMLFSANTNQNTDELDTHPSNTMCTSLDNSRDTNDNPQDTTSHDCFYEKQFNDALEFQFSPTSNEVVNNDSSVLYNDDSALNSLDSDLGLPSDQMVKERKQLLERKSSLKKYIHRLEVRGAEKGQGILDIMKTLEGTNEKTKEEGIISPPVTIRIKTDDMASAVKMSPLMTQRNKSRELMEVAMLTRIRKSNGDDESSQKPSPVTDKTVLSSIRQSSFDGLQSDGEQPFTCACECNGEGNHCEGENLKKSMESTVTNQCKSADCGVDDGDCGEDANEKDNLPKKGWVKHVISQLQDGSSCS